MEYEYAKVSKSRQEIRRRFSGRRVPADMFGVWGSPGEEDEHVMKEEACEHQSC